MSEDFKAKEAVEKRFAESSTQPNDSNTLNALDTISRQSAIDAIDEIESEVADGDGFQYEKWRQYFCELPSADIDLSDYSDRLWCNAYERGKADAEPRWIPCSERLPLKPGFYMVTVGAPYKPVRVYEYNPCEGYENGNLWKGEGGAYVFNWFVEAWQNLPEPWKGESDEH